jgi:hypothetical protein
MALVAMWLDLAACALDIIEGRKVVPEQGLLLPLQHPLAQLLAGDGSALLPLCCMPSVCCSST